MVTLLHPLMFLEESLFEGMHAVGIAWGLAIVALTLLVRLALLPIAVRQATARRRQAAHAPQLKALRERHREDVSALRSELEAYRREHGLRPRGAILGFVLQVLVAMSLAFLLRSDAAGGTFGDASWLFIADLSKPAGDEALALLLGGSARRAGRVAGLCRAVGATAAGRHRAARAGAAAGRSVAGPGGGPGLRVRLRGLRLGAEARPAGYGAAARRDLSRRWARASDGVGRSIRCSMSSAWASCGRPSLSQAMSTLSSLR